MYLLLPWSTLSIINVASPWHTINLQADYWLAFGGGNANYPTINTATGQPYTTPWGWPDLLPTDPSLHPPTDPNKPNHLWTGWVFSGAWKIQSDFSAIKLDDTHLVTRRNAKKLTREPGFEITFSELGTIREEFGDLQATPSSSQAFLVKFEDMRSIWKQTTPEKTYNRTLGSAIRVPADLRNLVSVTPQLDPTEDNTQGATENLPRYNVDRPDGTTNIQAKRDDSRQYGGLLEPTEQVNERPIVPPSEITEQEVPSTWLGVLFDMLAECGAIVTTQQNGIVTWLDLSGLDLPVLPSAPGDLDPIPGESAWDRASRLLAETGHTLEPTNSGRFKVVELIPTYPSESSFAHPNQKPVDRSYDLDDAWNQYLSGITGSKRVQDTKSQIGKKKPTIPAFIEVGYKTTKGAGQWAIRSGTTAQDRIQAKHPHVLFSPEYLLRQVGKLPTNIAIPKKPGATLRERLDEFFASPFPRKHAMPSMSLFSKTFLGNLYVPNPSTDNAGAENDLGGGWYLKDGKHNNTKLSLVRGITGTHSNLPLHRTFMGSFLDGIISRLPKP